MNKNVQYEFHHNYRYHCYYGWAKSHLHRHLTMGTNRKCTGGRLVWRGNPIKIRLVIVSLLLLLLLLTVSLLLLLSVSLLLLLPAVSLLLLLLKWSLVLLTIVVIIFHVNFGNRRGANTVTHTKVTTYGMKSRKFGILKLMEIDSYEIISLLDVSSLYLLCAYFNILYFKSLVHSSGS